MFITTFEDSEFDKVKIKSYYFENQVYNIQIQDIHEKIY